MRAEDLFEEDLAVLHEQDRQLLKTLAAHLPNTAAELARRLEGEITPERLREKLNEFLGTRLIRLAGNVFDTYNDVFKTYLVTGLVPFQSRFILRSSPRAAIQELGFIRLHDRSDIAAYQKLAGGNENAVLNKLRELRELGLIERTPGIVSLSPAARVALDQGTVAELLRRSLRANGLVTAIMDLLASRGDLSVSDVKDSLQRELPNVDFSDKTWYEYTRTLIAWLDFSGLASFEADTLRNRDVAPVALEYKKSLSRGSFIQNTFMPQARPLEVKRLLIEVQSGPKTIKQLYPLFGQRDAAAVVQSAASLDLVELKTDDTVVLGRQGQALLQRSPDPTAQEIAELCLSKPNVKAYLDHIDHGTLTMQGQREIIDRFGRAAWSDSTWESRMGVLRAWLIATGMAHGYRGSLRKPTPAQADLGLH